MLNGGWAFTTAAPLPSPGTGWTLPAQALVVFVEAEWPELNRPQDVMMELLDEDAEHVTCATKDRRNRPGSQLLSLCQARLGPRTVLPVGVTCSLTSEEGP